MNSEDVAIELERIEKYFFNPENWINIELTHSWVTAQPDDAGVYMIFDDAKPVYVGETGNLRGRMRDMLDSRHHTVRRSLGEGKFSNIESYEKASSKRKHPPHIEELINSTLTGYKLCRMEISFGRKEIEEHFQDKFQPSLNRKSKRKSR